ncbi:MAG: hypothetical protein ABIH67_05135 [Candidatus Uhrbacteria bacterium]
MLMVNPQAKQADEEMPYVEAEQAELPKPITRPLPVLQTRVRMFAPVKGTARDENGEVQDAFYWTSQELAIDLKSCRGHLGREAYLEFRDQVLEIMKSTTLELYGADKVLGVRVAHIQDHLNDAGGPKNNGLGSNLCIAITWWPMEGTLKTNSRQHEDTHVAKVIQAVLSLYQHHLSDHQSLHLVKG